MIAWIVENSELLLGALGALIALAVVVAKLTPTKKDDAVIGKIAALWQKFQKKADKLPPQTH